MIVKHEERDGALHFIFIGELDHHSAATVREETDAVMDGAACQRVVFDLSYLSFMDSSGIGVLLGRYKRLAERKIPAYILNPVPIVDRILTMSGVYKLIKRL